MKLRCAILDDYQNAALHSADWSTISEQVEVQVFQQHFDQEDELVSAIQDYDIIVAMRERTPFKAPLFARLPRLKLLITTGMRNASIDLAAAASHGVVVSGTSGSGDPTTELTWALILGLARHIVPEHNAIQSNGPWQSTIGMDLQGKSSACWGLANLAVGWHGLGRPLGWT